MGRIIHGSHCGKGTGASGAKRRENKPHVRQRFLPRRPERSRREVVQPKADLDFELELSQKVDPDLEKILV